MMEAGMDNLAGEEALDKHADMSLRKVKYKWNWILPEVSKDRLLPLHRWQRKRRENAAECCVWLGDTGYGEDLPHLSLYNLDRPSGMQPEEQAGARKDVPLLEKDKVEEC